MIQNKPKTCKGKGKASGYKNACREVKYIKQYGLCPACLYDFYTETDVGKVLYQKLFLPKVSKRTKERKKETETKMRDNIKTRSDYERELQKEINTIVRLIDKGGCCISSRKPLNAKFDAGHFYSVGSNPALRFNLFNIYAQSVYANQYLSGDLTNFLSGLEHFYGKEHKEYVLSLKSQIEWLKLSTDEMKEATKKAKEIIKELKANDAVYSPLERLELRDKYNKELGIYTTKNQKNQ